MAKALKITNPERNRFSLKSRLWYAGATGLMVVLGLCSRIFQAGLPAFVSAHFGDALWAAMVYYIFRTLFVKKGMVYGAMGALLFSFFIELSQLYQAAWINEIRQTLPGSLILGRGFLTVDLVRYTAGVAFAYLADRFLLIYLLPAEVQIPQAQK